MKRRWGRFGASRRWPGCPTCSGTSEVLLGQAVLKRAHSSGVGRPIARAGTVALLAGPTGAGGTKLFIMPCTAISTTRETRPASQLRTAILPRLLNESILQSKYT